MDAAWPQNSTPGAAVRKGAATAFRAWFGRTAGYHGARDWLASDLFGGADFQEGWLIRQCLENWGDRKPEGCPCVRGRARDARKEKAVAGTVRRHIPLAGIRNELPWTLLPQAISRSVGEATPISC